MPPTTSTTRRKLLLTAAAPPLIAAACSPFQREVTGPAKDVTGTIIYKTQVPGGPAQLAFDAAMVEFRKAYPQITVETEFTPTEPVYLTELRAQLAGGTPP